MPTFGLLGPVHIDRAPVLSSALGVPVDEGRRATRGDETREETGGLRPQHRAVLGYLLLHAGQVITFDRLLGAVWGAAAPATARTQIHAAVSTLRRTLRSVPANLRSAANGYVIEVGADEIDLDVFRRDAGRAAGSGSPETAATLLTGALGLWRGDALADITSEYAVTERARLAEERLLAYERLADAELALGRLATLLPRQQRLVEENPLRERLTQQLMLGLYRDGKQVEALASYERLRTRLTEELGISPEPALRDLHLAILRHDPGLTAPAPSRVDTVERPAPATLPPAVPGFVGRAAELRRLDQLARPSGDCSVAVVCGTAGVGKTSLAVRWAQAAAPAFPDGQLYAHLRGFAPQTIPADPAEVLRGFLDALGVPAERLPATVDAQAALYRTLLARRRMLVMLDDARDAEQVRLLLPASPGCFTLITSRKQLTSLVVTNGADLLPLELLSTQESRRLLRTRLGQERIAAEAPAVERIIDRCAGLPLALAIVAARVALRPHRPLAEVVGGFGLDQFAADDPVTDLRMVFAQSYHDLSTPAARAFRLLGLHPGHTVTRTAAAGLFGADPAGASELLAELGRAHLVAELPDGRCGQHDLLRAYALEMTATLDPAGRVLAERRLVEHYRRTAYAAHALLSPHRDGPAAEPEAAGVAGEPLADRAAALAWFRVELPALLAVLDRGVKLGLARAVTQIAWAMADYLHQYGHWTAMLETQTAALEAARSLADRPAQARAHNSLARAHMRLGGRPAAISHFHAAIELFIGLGDGRGEAHTHLGLNWVYSQDPGDHGLALSHSQTALDLFRRAGDEVGEARALNCVGYGHALAGRYEQALADCGTAQRALARLGFREGEAYAWDSMAYAHRHLGDPGRSVRCYLRAVDLFRGLDQRRNEADTLIRLGEALSAVEDRDGARRVWQRALAILEEFGDPQAASVRERLL